MFRWPFLVTIGVWLEFVNWQRVSGDGQMRNSEGIFLTLYAVI